MCTFYPVCPTSWLLVNKEGLKGKWIMDHSIFPFPSMSLFSPCVVGCLYSTSALFTWIKSLFKWKECPVGAVSCLDYSPVRPNYDVFSLSLFLILGNSYTLWFGWNSAFRALGKWHANKRQRNGAAICCAYSSAHAHSPLSSETSLTKDVQRWNYWTFEDADRTASDHDGSSECGSPIHTIMPPHLWV